jgi:hypothetical protein
MKVLKKLRQRLLKSQEDTLSKRFLQSDIRDISLRDWDDMHKGHYKSFIKKAWRFLFRLVIRILKVRIESKLDDLYNQVFKEFGAPVAHLEKTRSLKKELRLRCDAVIKNDKTLEVMANIEAETRETINKESGKGIGIEQSLMSINLDKGTKYDMNTTTVSEYYNIINVLNNA